MRTESHHVYTYNELSDRAKEHARNWYRKLSDGEDYWTEGCVEQVTDVATSLGITITTRQLASHSSNPKHVSKGEPSIYFSGVGSQGDGACFHGSWHADRMTHTLEEFTAECGTGDPVLLALYRRLAWCRDAYPESSCTSSGNVTMQYCHEHSTYIEASLGRGVVDTADTTQHGRDLEECLRDFMRWIYALLKAEDQYRNSDEAVATMMTSNEYEFSENGTRA